MFHIFHKTTTIQAPIAKIHFRYKVIVCFNPLFAFFVLKIIGHRMNVIKHLKDHINWFPGHMQKTLRLIE
jgi:hypothetical protein